MTDIVERVERWITQRAREQVFSSAEHLLESLVAEIKQLRSENPQTYECEECCFRFDAAHTDHDGGHTCPVCENVKLTDEIERLRASIGKLANEHLAIKKAIGPDWWIDPPDHGWVVLSEQVARMAAEIERLRALTTPQPIETAPRDGTPIRVVSDVPYRGARWVEPSGWLPLPEGPK